MTQGLVTDTYMSDLADAIRAKLGTEDTYTPAEMADAILSIGGGSVEIVPWSSGTDEQIAAMIDAAHNGDIDLQTDGGWAVGDVRTISISAFSGGYSDSAFNVKSHSAQSIDIVITSFDEYNNCGNVLQFDFKDSLSNRLKMDFVIENSSSKPNNIGGYEVSKVNTSLIPALINALPSWLKERLVTFDIKTTVGGGSSTIVTSTGYKLALRSVTEIMGNVTYAINGEGEQLAYYSESINNKRKKEGHGGSYEDYWTRTAYTGDSTQYVKIINNSNSMSTYPNGSGESRPVAPFGCL